MAPVTPTEIKSPEEEDGDEEAPAAEAAAVAEAMTETTQSLNNQLEKK